MNEYIKISKALSDTSRVIMLKLLETSDLCVCEIQTAFDFSQPTISKHLKVLEDAGLVTSAKKGLWVHYRLNRNNTSEYIDSTLNNLSKWFNDDSELKMAKEKIQLTTEK